MGETCELCESLNDSEVTNERTHINRTGKWILGITGLSLVGIVAVSGSFISPALRKVCLPYVPATTRQVSNVMQMLEGKSGKLLDLGSGDGRLVIEAAKRGFHAEGVELNPWLVWYSRYRAWREGVSGTARFYRKDIFKTNLYSYNHVIIFGVDSMMESLATTIEDKATDQCHVIACRFPFAQWTATKTIDAGIDTVWSYEPLTKDSGFTDT